MHKRRRTLERQQLWVIFHQGRAGGPPPCQSRETAGGKGQRQRGFQRAGHRSHHAGANPETEGGDHLQFFPWPGVLRGADLGELPAAGVLHPVF